MNKQELELALREAGHKESASKLHDTPDSAVDWAYYRSLLGILSTEEINEPTESAETD